MIIIRIMGGLGNQMFQYALYKAMHVKGKDVKLDLSWCLRKKEHNGYELERIFNVDGIYATKTQADFLGEINYGILNRIFRKYVKHKKTYYYQDVNNAILFNENIFCYDNIYLSGYFQSEKYFSFIKNKIADIYTFPDLIDAKNLEIKDFISKSNSVSLHIRRGDYLKSKYLKGICNETYYNKAVSYILNKVHNPVFFVFSDDIDWCKNNLALKNVFYVQNNIGINSYIDMQLMSMCNHNIIANSTFSWWGAWLNKNEDKIVVAPKKWFNKENILTNDLLLDKWIKIKT